MVHNIYRVYPQERHNEMVKKRYEPRLRNEKKRGGSILDGCKSVHFLCKRGSYIGG